MVTSASPTTDSVAPSPAMAEATPVKEDGGLFEQDVDLLSPNRNLAPLTARRDGHGPAGGRRLPAERSDPHLRHPALCAGRGHPAGHLPGLPARPWPSTTRVKPWRSTPPRRTAPWRSPLWWPPRVWDSMPCRPGSCSRPWRAACPPSGSCCTATTSRPKSSSSPSTGASPWCSTTGTTSNFSPGWRPPAPTGARAGAVHAGHRMPHPRVHPHRSPRQQVRLRPRSAGVGAAASGRLFLGLGGWSPRPHRFPDLRAATPPGPGRGDGRGPCPGALPRPSLPRPQRRRWARHPLRRLRRSAEHPGVGAGGGRGGGRGLQGERSWSCPGCCASRAVPWWPRPDSPSTRWEAARRFPACGPTCRWMAA